MKADIECSYGADELDAVAEKLLNVEGIGKKIAFSGDLGTGKTSLIKALVANLGVSDPVESPSFSLINEYGNENAQIIHADLYRLKGYEELLDIGWEELLDRSAWLFVEWPEIAPEAIEDFSLIKLSVEANGQKRKLALWCASS